VPEFLDPVYAKTSPKRLFSMIENKRFGLVSMIENERFRLVSAKIGPINSGTGGFDTK
jgi:hypothetical protein